MSRGASTFKREFLQALQRSSEMGFLDLFVVAMVPVLKVLLITLVGLFLALDRIDLLGSTARPYLNNLIFYVFSPALVSSQLAGTITLQSLASLWFMPVNILLTFIIGSVLAWILIKITRTPPHLQGLVIGCCSAGNLGNLLLIIVPAVCNESNSPFGDSTVCSSYGMAYASLSMAVGAIYIWTYVYIIMRIYADNSAENTENVSIADSESYTEALLPSSEKSSCHDHSELPETMSEGKVTFMERTYWNFKKFAANTNLKKVFAPATIAAMFGFLIGTISPIRKVIIGDSAPLRVLESSASLLGQASIPCMALIMGSNLLKGLRRSEINVSVIAGIVVVRNFFLPLIGIGIVKAAHHFGLVGSDSLYQFILLLQYALPPAMAIGVMAQLFKAGESECSVIMLWCYVLAAFSLTLWSTFYMWLLG
nr:protein PIN-LIKES 3-like isoform X2 [Populus alba]